MNALASRVVALHSGLWAVDPWYQRSWFVAPPAIALVLAGWMIYLGDKAGSAEEGRDLAEARLTDGSGAQSRHILRRGSAARSRRIVSGSRHGGCHLATLMRPIRPSA